jgi:hypothetical protein
VVAAGVAAAERAVLKRTLEGNPNQENLLPAVHAGGEAPEVLFHPFRTCGHAGQKGWKACSSYAGQMSRNVSIWAPTEFRRSARSS